MLILSSVSAEAVQQSAPTAGSVAVTVIVGLFVVFAVLAIIYLAMTLMERAFRKKSAAITIESPFDGTLERVLAQGAVRSGDAVVVILSQDGRRSEVLSPVDGTVRITLAEGERFKAGKTIFTVE